MIHSAGLQSDIAAWRPYRATENFSLRQAREFFNTIRQNTVGEIGGWGRSLSEPGQGTQPAAGFPTHEGPPDCRSEIRQQYLGQPMVSIGIPSAAPRSVAFDSKTLGLEAQTEGHEGGTLVTVKDEQHSAVHIPRQRLGGAERVDNLGAVAQRRHKMFAGFLLPACQ